MNITLWTKICDKLYLVSWFVPIPKEICLICKEKMHWPAFCKCNYICSRETKQFNNASFWQKNLDRCMMTVPAQLSQQGTGPSSSKHTLRSSEVILSTSACLWPCGRSCKAHLECIWASGGVNENTKHNTKAMLYGKNPQCFDPLLACGVSGYSAKSWEVLLVLFCFKRW